LEVKRRSRFPTFNKEEFNKFTAKLPPKWREKMFPIFNVVEQNLGEILCWYWERPTDDEVKQGAYVSLIVTLKKLNS